MRETSIGCLLHTPNWGPGLQPRHVPGPGIEWRSFGSQAQSTELNPLSHTSQSTHFVIITPTMLKTGLTHSFCNSDVAEGIKSLQAALTSKWNEGSLSSCRVPTPGWLQAEHPAGTSLWKLSHFCGLLSLWSLVLPTVRAAYSWNL